MNFNYKSLTLYGSFLFIFFFEILNVMSQDKKSEILSWRPPKAFKKMFPYYLTGYDRHSTPVWVSRYGSWDIRALVEEGGDTLENFDLYMRQGMERLTTPKLFNKPGKTQNSFIGIVDLGGYSTRQLYHYPTVRKSLGYAAQFIQTLQDNGSDMKRIILINCNWMSRVLWGIAQPVLGSAVEKFELYGTNKKEWQRAILNHIDSDQLPPWLGGSSEGPIKVFG